MNLETCFECGSDFPEEQMVHVAMSHRVRVNKKDSQGYLSHDLLDAMTVCIDCGEKNSLTEGAAMILKSKVNQIR